MSKHKMVDGRLLQMNKSYGQLKQKQKEKISEWMYQAYRKQTSENLSDEEALQLIFDRIDGLKRQRSGSRIMRSLTVIGKKRTSSGNVLPEKMCLNISL